MIADYSCPESVQPSVIRPSVIRTSREGATHLAARWEAAELGRLARHLDTAGRAALAELSRDEILAAWNEAVDRLLDPTSEARRALDPALEHTLGYSAPLLQASLEAMLSGYRGRPAETLFERAERLPPQPPERPAGGLVLAVLAGNVPGLAVQVALPALAVRRPLLLKSSRREPLLSAALVDLVAAARPELADALAAATWPGGETALEKELLATARTVVAFGGRAALDDLGRRHAELVGRGPMFSVAIVGRDAELAPTAAALAEQIALFEQRGCLSVVAVWVEDPSAAASDGPSVGRASEMAGALADALRQLADRWPPPERDAATLAAIQQMRRDAELRGARVLPLDLAAGSVVLEPEVAYRPVPEARAVRIHAVDSLERLPAILEPLAGRIQGVALAGQRARALGDALRSLGVRRLVPPGELQRPDALWANGERHLIEELI